jgi:prepilin-type N-terminal cleavage/methylation domain-containing protein
MKLERQINLIKTIGQNKAGFTLVELMVVVVIIGVLVAIAVPVYNNITIRAEQATVEANLRIIDSSILRYYALSLSIKQGYEITLLSLPAGQGSIEATPTALDIQDPELPNELSEVKELVEAGYLASVPSGPGSVSYGITGEAPNQRATATGEVGKDKLSGTTFDNLPWREVKPAVVTDSEAGEDNEEDTSAATGSYLLTGNDIEFGLVYQSPGITAYNYNGLATDIIIPSYNDNGELIRRIKDNLFQNKGLTSVILPEGLTWIDGYVLAGNSLTEIEIPKSVGSIRDNAFRGNQIQKLSLPDGLKTITQGAFGGNPIIEITIGSGVTIQNVDWKGNHVMGVYGEQFKAIYDANKESGTEAGTYLWNGTTWIKE